MAKDLTEAEVNELIAKLKKSDKKMEALADGEIDELDDESLDDVAGGFKSKKGYSKGYKVKCPNCGKKKKDTIYAKGKDKEAKCDYFYCNHCGTFFAVDVGGHIYETYF